jgi:hypothetical protein
LILDTIGSDKRANKGVVAGPLFTVAWIAPHPREVLSPVVGVATPAESLQERLKHDAEATRLGLYTATRKASLTLAERDGDDVVNASARLKDVVRFPALRR